MEPLASKALDVLLLLLFCLQPFHGQSNSDPLHYQCSVDYYNDTTKFGANLQALLTSLLNYGPTNGFFNNTVGELPDQIYGLVLCRADVKSKSCFKCLQTASDYIQKSCVISQSLSAILWYDRCLLRYSNNDFFGVADIDGFFMYNGLNVSKGLDNSIFHWEKSGVRKRKQKAFITSLVENTPTKPLLYEVKDGRAYGVVQCTRDLTARTCRNCLMTVMDQLESCCYGKKTWRYLAHSCGIWYDHRFFTATDLRNLLIFLGSLIFIFILCICWDVVLYIVRHILLGIIYLLVIPVMLCFYGCKAILRIGGSILSGIAKLLCSPFRICKGNDLEEGVDRDNLFNGNKHGGGVSMPTDKNKVGGGVTKPTDIPSKGNKLGGVSMPTKETDVGGGGTKVEGVVTKLTDIPSKETKVGGSGSKEGGGVSMPINKNEAGRGRNKVGGISKPTVIPSKGKEVGGGGNKLGGSVSKPTDKNPSKGKEVGGGGNKLGGSVSKPTEKNEVGGGGNKDGGVSKPRNIPSKGNEVEGGENKLGGSISKPTNKNEVGEGGNKNGGVSISPNIPSKGNELGGGENKDGGVSKPANIPSKGNEAEAGGNKLGGGSDGDNVVRTQELRCVDISVLRLATENFSDANELGSGGFGVVYKGTFNDGMEVAVKKLRSTGRRPKDFKREVQSLAEIQHRNVVKLNCFCIDEQDYYLVYEYIPNRSLAYNLFDKSREDKLDMGKRRNITQGIAKGIRYLHEESRVTIIHRDLKPENILLDCNMNPKIADFGNAKIFSDEQIVAFASELIVSRGYMPREYLLGGEYSRATDVFSFGVLLLEIISGEQNCSFHNLLAKAWNLWSSGKHIEFVDPFLIESCSTEDARHEIEKKSLRWIHVGLSCVQDDPTPRPTMTKVLQMLEGDSTIDIQPTQPPIEYATKYTTQSSFPRIMEPSFSKVTSSDSESE